MSASKSSTVSPCKMMGLSSVRPSACPAGGKLNMLVKALDSLPTSSRFWTLNNLSPILMRIIRGDIEVYLEYSIFVLQIVFIVSSRHEWVFSCVQRSRCYESLTRQKCGADKLGGA